MKYIKSNFVGNECVVYPLGDWHLGSEHCDEKLIRKTIEEIKANKNARIILMGDLSETATKDSVGAGVYEQKENAQQTMMTIKSILWEVRDRIDGIVTGNHEERIYKTSGFDITLYLAQILGIEDKYMRYQGVVAYTLNKRTFTINVWHGSGGGGSAGASLNKLQRQADYINCDIYLMGHVHKRQVHTKTMFLCDTRNNKIVKQDQYFIVTGSTLDYENSYAEMVGLVPSMKGFTKIVLSSNGIETKNKKQMRKKEIQVIL
jgi:predicted phosphodiesterase